MIGQTLGGNDQYLASLKGVPVLTLTHPLGPNMEKLATYNPSIVLSSKTWQRGTPAMRKLGMKVYESDPNSVAAVGTETRNIGKLLGRTRAANDLANKIAGDVAAAKRNIRSRPRVLVILGVGRTPYAMLANSWGGDVVAQAGGTLLTQGLTSPSGTARISDEIVVKRNPDIIIAVPHGSPGNIPKLAAYYREQPELAQHERGQATTASTSPPGTRCCSRIRASPRRSATSAQVLEELIWLHVASRSSSSVRPRSSSPRRRRWRSAPSTCRCTTSGCR